MSDSLQLMEENGVALLSGELDFSSTPPLLLALKSLINKGSITRISLKNVESSNSAALAMLVEVKAMAKKHGQTVHIVDLPKGLSDLANMSNSLALLEAL